MAGLVLSTRPRRTTPIARLADAVQLTLTTPRDPQPAPKPLRRSAALIRPALKIATPLRGRTRLPKPPRPQTVVAGAKRSAHPRYAALAVVCGRVRGSTKVDKVVVGSARGGAVVAG